jgi:hypothetical protein
VLALAAEPDSAAVRAARLGVVRRVVLAWGLVRTLVWISLDAPIPPAVLGGTAALLAVAAALAFVPRRAATAGVVALPAVTAQVVATFPLTPNHLFLELYAVGLLALADRAGRDDGLVLAGLRWLTALVLFVTGVQKLAFGHYVTGDFLAFMVGRGDRFADLFAWVLPADELTRLASYDPLRGGSGPYRVTVPAFVLLSNLVWVAEVSLPVGMLVRRTRTVAAMLAIAFVLAIQLGARELGFALLFTNLLALFAPLGVQRATSVVSYVVLAVAALLAAGPGSVVVRAWHLW